MATFFLSDLEREARVSMLQQKLSESGGRTTPQRLHVLRALLETSTHPTAEEVWERVREVSPTTSLGTIYKTLDTLKEMGEVILVDSGDDRHHYDARRPHPHPHVVCQQCGKIEDVDIEGLDGLQARASTATGYQIAEQRLTFYGVCADCAELRSLNAAKR